MLPRKVNPSFGTPHKSLDNTLGSRCGGASLKKYQSSGECVCFGNSPREPGLILLQMAEIESDFVYG